MAPARQAAERRILNSKPSLETSVTYSVRLALASALASASAMVAGLEAVLVVNDERGKERQLL